MNQKEIMKQRNDVARKFEFSSKAHRNCIRINIHNSREHELCKFNLAWSDLKNGHEFLTEAKCKDRIADFVCLDFDQVTEIQHTESDESIEAKRKFWESLGFKFNSVRA